jgi:hypothetical protein
MKLTCDEATLICDKNQYKEATFWEKIKLNLHVFLCKKCGLYSKQNSIMTTCYKKHKNNKTMYNDCLCEEEKKAMNKEFKAKL